MKHITGRRSDEDATKIDGKVPGYTFDEFLRRRTLIAEYTAHRVLAGHVPYERCAGCDQILATFNASTEGQTITDAVFAAS